MPRFVSADVDIDLDKLRYGREFTAYDLELFHEWDLHVSAV